MAKQSQLKIISALATIALLLFAFQNCSGIDGAGALGLGIKSKSSQSTESSGNGDTYAGFAPGSYLNVKPNSNLSSFEISAGIEIENGVYFYREANSSKRVVVQESEMLKNPQTNSFIYDGRVFTPYSMPPDFSSLISLQEAMCWSLPGMNGITDTSGFRLFISVSYYLDGHREATLQTLATGGNSIQQFPVAHTTDGGIAIYSGTGSFGQAELRVDSSNLVWQEGGYRGSIAIRPKAGANTQSNITCQYNQF
jgi:hypothetical protein